MSLDRNANAEQTGFAPEIWKPIPGYEKQYAASSRGRIRNAKGLIKKQRLHRSAGGWMYRKVDLYKNNKRKTFRVQRLILMTFKGLPPKKIVARHMDGDTFNNAIENLEWGTQTENLLDFINRREEEWNRVSKQENCTR